MSTLVWVDGEVRTEAEARVAALDHGVTVGDGVFETCKVQDGQVFALTRHLWRLARSAARLGLTLPEDSLIRAAADRTVRAGDPSPLARLRITVTSGPGPLGSDRGGSPATLIVAISPARPWPTTIRAVTVPWRRNEHSAVAGVKTTSYAENVVALQAAHDADAHEALLANTAGNLCEGTGSNVLLVRQGRLLTPPLRSGCLAGITRELFLEWAAADGLAVEECDVPLAWLGDAEDVLLTSSTRDVQPVSSVDGRDLPGSEIGREAVEVFARHARESCDP